MTKYFIPNTDARKSLADKLSLRYHADMQDWEYEVADMNRLADFEKQYLLSDTNDKEKESLMEIMLDSLNDSLESNDLKNYNDFAPRILKYLNANSQIHEGTVKYWTEGDFLISNKIKPTLEK
jgi:hypothetical protein